jgi:hypothetical protein
MTAGTLPERGGAAAPEVIYLRAATRNPHEVER